MGTEVHRKHVPGCCSRQVSPLLSLSRTVEGTYLSFKHLKCVHLTNPPHPTLFISGSFNSSFHEACLFSRGLAQSSWLWSWLVAASGSQLIPFSFFKMDVGDVRMWHKARGRADLGDSSGDPQSVSGTREDGFRHRGAR